MWEASNRLCSKRLVPYLPTFVRALERFGHLKLTRETKQRLLGISPATVDRLLYQRRHGRPRTVASTARGPLLKHQIPVRTFTDWNEDRAGFLEADLVAHCGSTMAGVFVNSLVLTDVKTGWTECLALLYKDQDFVVDAVTEAGRRFPFPIRGLDTDNGSEFITGKLVAYCENARITFTRSRPYKKNDQCFVEQKNGQIVRRLIGYDRYEGVVAARHLAELYAVIRLYVNFFQPSMRLVSKSREGAKVRRVYDRPRTPYDRVLDSPEVTGSVKASLRRQYRLLDPVKLLAEIQRLQDQLWVHGNRELPSRRRFRPAPEPPESRKPQLAARQPERAEKRTYRRRKKTRKKCVRSWRSRADPFAGVWSECEKELILQPDLAATVLLARLQARHPRQYEDKLLRTMQRRVRAWKIARMREATTPTRSGDSLPDTSQIELVVPSIHHPLPPDRSVRF